VRHAKWSLSWWMAHGMRRWKAACRRETITIAGLDKVRLEDFRAAWEASSADFRAASCIQWEPLTEFHVGDVIVPSVSETHVFIGQSKTARPFVPAHDRPYAVGPSRIHGNGAIATRDIRGGEFILFPNGRAEMGKNWGGFNHSSNPNIEMPSNVRSGTPGGAEIYVLRDIAAGEELVMFYWHVAPEIRAKLWEAR
jgi:hypothetical protein